MRLLRLLVLFSRQLSVVLFLFKLFTFQFPWEIHSMWQDVGFFFLSGKHAHNTKENIYLTVTPLSFIKKSTCLAKM